jgi:hypothetical protein
MLCFKIDNPLLSIPLLLCIPYSNHKGYAHVVWAHGVVGPYCKSELVSDGHDGCGEGAFACARGGGGPGLVEPTQRSSKCS